MCIRSDIDNRSNPVFLQLTVESSGTNHVYEERHQTYRSSDADNVGNVILEGPSDRMSKDKEASDDKAHTITMLLFSFLVLTFLTGINTQLNNLKTESYRIKIEMRDARLNSMSSRRDCYYENDALWINNSQLESDRIRAEMQNVKLTSMSRHQYDENDASRISDVLGIFAVNVQVG